MTRQITISVYYPTGPIHAQDRPTTLQLTQGDPNTWAVVPNPVASVQRCAERLPAPRQRKGRS